MVFKRWFKDKQPVHAPLARLPGEPLLHELARRLRGTFDLDEILQLTADAVGEQLEADHCLIYLCDPNTDRLRWRAGHHAPGLMPLRWSLKESDFSELFTRLRKAETVLINDPLNDPLVVKGHSTFASANLRALVFIPVLSDQLEAILILGHTTKTHPWSDDHFQFLESVAATVAIACRHTNLSLALRQAGNEAYNATVDLQMENQYLQWLTQLLLYPSTDPAEVLDHISISLSELYNLDVCSIEQVHGEMVHVRSIRLYGQTTNLGVFPIEATPREPVVETIEKSICPNASEAYPQDRFLWENNLTFYAGVPIVNRTGELIGLLNLFHHETVEFKDRDFNLLAAIARRIAFELEAQHAVIAAPPGDEETNQRLQAVTEAEQEIKARFAEVREAERVMQEQRQEVAEAEQELARQREELVQAQQQLQEQRDEVKQKEQLLQQKDDTVSRAEQQLQQQRDELAETQQQLQRQREELSHAQQEAQRRLAEAAKAEQEAQRRRDELAKTQQELLQQGEELSKTEQELHQQRDELSHAQQALQQQQEELTRAQQELQQQREELSKTEQELQQQRDEIATAQQELQQQRDEIAKADQELQQQRDELAQAQQQLQQQRDELATADQDLQQQRDEIAKADQELQQQRDELSQAQQQLQQQRDELATAQQELQRQRDELSQAQQQLQQQRDELAKTNQELQQQRDELSQAQQQLQQQRDELAKADQDLQQRRDELAKTNEELQQQRDELAKTNQELQQQRAEVAQAQQALQQQREGLATTDQELQQRRDELSRTQQQLQHRLDEVAQASQGDVVVMDWSFFSDLLALIEHGSSVEQVCVSLVEELIEFLPGSAVAIWLLGPPTEERPGLAPVLTQVAGRGGPVDRLAARGPIPLGEGVIGRVAGGRNTLTIADVHQPGDVPEDLRSLLSPDEAYSSATIIPLKTWNKTLGVILLFSADASAAQPRTRSFLEAVAYCLGNFIEQSHMMDTVSRHSKELMKMRTMIESIAEPANLTQVCDDILRNVADSLDASHGALFLRQPDEDALQLFRHRGLDKTLVELAHHLPLEQAHETIGTLGNGEPLIISDLEADPQITTPEVVDRLRAEGLRSGVILPLQSDDELVGLLILASQEPSHFSHYSCEFLSIITHRIANTVRRLRQPAVAEEIQRPGGQPVTLSAAQGSTARQLNETLLENLTSGVVAIDRAGCITIFNPAMEQLTGYRRQEVVGLPIVASTPSGAPPLPLFSHANPFDEALSTGQPITKEEVQLLMKDSGKKYATMTVMPLADEQGTLVGAVGLFTDITEIRALEYERYRLTPLALIGEMSARLAHEIKNPLASMMSGLELLKRRLKYGEREGRYFDRLIAELQRLDTTVREMLAYSRTAPPTLEPTDPTVPLEHALDTLAPQLEETRIEVTRDYQLGAGSPCPYVALIDANQLEQAFLNLIINAIQAMPHGGQLNVSVGTVSMEKENGTTATAIQYTISDTGTGVPANVIDKIFDPFFSTKTHGTGLGLASVKKIIESHRGEIGFESQAEQGTTFTIRLAAQPADEPANP